MNLKALSYKIRKDIVDLIYTAKSGHIGGDMSVPKYWSLCISPK